MKVRLIHPERRTTHSIQLRVTESPALPVAPTWLPPQKQRTLPGKLKPTQRCEFVLRPGESFNFNAALAGKLGEVPFMVELEADNDAPLFMCLAHGDVEKQEMLIAPQPACRSFSLALTLQAGQEHSFSMNAPEAVNG